MNFLTRIALLAAFVIPVGVQAAGAIAVDDEQGDTEPGYGVVVGADTREAAGRDAMKECRKSGNKNCKVVVRFDKCGAYAGSKNYFGVGWGTTKAAANAMALKECGNGACKVHVSECE
ncbi:MAG TPA: DUF4189 domain-containing protein [Ramlibacter sp.]|jgi:hypothetical protein